MLDYGSLWCKQGSEIYSQLQILGGWIDAREKLPGFCKFFLKRVKRIQCFWVRSIPVMSSLLPLDAFGAWDNWGSFLVNLMSVLMPLREFGLFMGLCWEPGCCNRFRWVTFLQKHDSCEAVFLLFWAKLLEAQILLDFGYGRMTTYNDIRRWRWFEGHLTSRSCIPWRWSRESGGSSRKFLLNRRDLCNVPRWRASQNWQTPQTHHLLLHLRFANIECAPVVIYHSIIYKPWDWPRSESLKEILLWLAWWWPSRWNMLNPIDVWCSNDWNVQMGLFNGMGESPCSNVLYPILQVQQRRFRLRFLAGTCPSPCSAYWSGFCLRHHHFGETVQSAQYVHPLCSFWWKFITLDTINIMIHSQPVACSEADNRADKSKTRTRTRDAVSCSW